MCTREMLLSEAEVLENYVTKISLILKFGGSGHMEVTATRTQLSYNSS